MATRPAQICQLQKGKLVDTQQGFVDTFNWAVQSIANLKGGQNCEVTWPTDDHPQVDCTAENGEGGSGGKDNPSEVTLHGTDASTATSDDFTFVSGADSNVEVKLNASNEIEIHVYYV